MALIDQNNLINSASIKETKDVTEVKPMVDENAPSTLGAAFRQENTISNIYGALTKDRKATNPDFDPFAGIEGYEQYANEFIYADSEDEVNQVKTKIDKELADRQKLEEAGWTGIAAMMFAGVLDPTMLIPGTAAVKAVTKGAKIAKGALAGGALTSAAVGTQEAVLQAAQQTRTIEESVMATAAGGILGGVVGGAIAGLSKGAKSAAQEELLAILKGEKEANLATQGFSLPKLSKEPKISTQLSAEAIDEGVAKLGSKGGNIVGATGLGEKVGSFGFDTPITRGLRSESEIVRKFTNDLFEHNILLNKTELGAKAQQQAAESFMKLDQGAITRMNSQVEKLYLDYVGLGGKSFAKSRAVLGDIKEGTLRFDKFNEEIAKALRRGDESAIPQVAAAAKTMRAEMDKATKALQDLGILPEGMEVKTARSYFSRFYDKNKIIARRDEFTNTVRRYIERENPTYTAEKIEETTKGIVDRIIRQDDQALALNDVANRVSTRGGKFTKERVFLIPDEEIEDFLINDGVGVTSNYLYRASALRRFHEVLQRSGYETLSDVRKSLKTKLDEAISKDPGRAVELTEKFNRDINIIDDHASIILGQYHATGELSRKIEPHLNTLRRYQFLRLLGGVTVSSIPDLAMPVLRHGLPKFLKTVMQESVTNIKAARLAKNELKIFNVGLELEESNVLRMIADPSFAPAVGKAQRIGDSVSEFFGRAAGITYWNNIGKRQAGFMSSARTLDTIMKGGRASAKDKKRLLKLGLDVDMQKRIKAQWDRFGTESRGVKIAHYERWDDIQARDAFGAALIKDVDSTIITPGRGDLPLIVQKSGWAKVIAQFKSFAYAASNKILVPAMQDRDMNTLMGILMLTYLGTLTTSIKDQLAGREVERDFWETAVEGMSRSGLAGILGDVALAVSPYNSSRFASQNVNNFFLGPSATLIGDVYGAFKRIAGTEELSASDLKKIVKMLPFQNIFWIRMILDKLGD